MGKFLGNQVSNSKISTSENDGNSRLEKLFFQSAGRSNMCTFVAIWGGSQ